MPPGLVDAASDCEAGGAASPDPGGLLAESDEHRRPPKGQPGHDWACCLKGLQANDGQRRHLDNARPSGVYDIFCNSGLAAMAAPKEKSLQQPLLAGLCVKNIL